MKAAAAYAYAQAIHRDLHVLCQVGRTRYHGCHCAIGAGVVLLVVHEPLQQDGAQQREPPQRDEHRNIETARAWTSRQAHVYEGQDQGAMQSLCRPVNCSLGMASAQLSQRLSP